MSELAMVLGLVLGIVCVSLATLHSWKAGRLTLLDWAVLGMGGVYGFGWVIVCGVTTGGGNPTWENWLLPFEALYPVHTACVVILAAGLWLGWLLGRHATPRRASRAPTQRLLIDRRLETAAWLLLCIATSMHWLYTRAYGGLLGLLDYSAAIRSAVFTVENRWSFLQPFGGLAFFSSFVFWGLWLARRRSLGVVVGLAGSLVVSIYILYSRLGRIQFLVFVMTFLLATILVRRPRPLPLLMAGGLLMLTILFGAYYISVLLALKAADSMPEFLARELAFPFGSFFAQLHADEHLWRGFRDFLYAPLYLLPSSWWSIWHEELSQVNTALIMGAPKGEQGVTGGIPVDLLTLGLMQANVYGIMVVGVLFGSMLRVLQWWLDSIPNLGVGAAFGAYVALKVAVLGAFYAQPALVVSGNFDLLVSAIVVAVLTRLPALRLAPLRTVAHVAGPEPQS